MTADTTVQDGVKPSVSPRNDHFTRIIQTQTLSKHTVIGIYGISGSGKSFILDILRNDLDPAHFILIEGSEVIDLLVPGGLTQFRESHEKEQPKLRIKAIDFIKNETVISGKYCSCYWASDALLIGLEECDISHVQGHSTTGHRLRNEYRTSIVALMRGGEAMAFGIRDVFPKAMFTHASCADDIKLHHVQGQATVILVDSVADSGKTLIESIKRVGHLGAKVHIVIVAGVVQVDAVAESQILAKAMRYHGASMITLKVSDNKFTGTKTTDTSNRVFNTTHLV